MKKLSCLLSALGGVCLLVFLLYVVIALSALTPSAYPPDPPFDQMALEVTAYLRGEASALSPSLFTERERLHMADVQMLFLGGRTLSITCGLLALCLLGASLLLGKRKAVGKGMLWGFMLFGAMGLGIALWAALDFTGWFTTMHEWVFTNDLWLLDPAESMLIQMVPEPFFRGMLTRVGLGFAAGAAALTAAACFLYLYHPKGKRGL